MVWRFLKKLRTKPPHDPEIPLLGIYSEETEIEKETCTPLFISALFKIARTWKQPRCPLTDEWIKKLWYIYTMKYSVQFSRSVMSDSLQPHELQHARPPCPSPTPGVYSTHAHRVGDAIQPSHTLSSPLLLPPIPPSIRVFSNESTVHMRWPQYWSFSFSISPSNEYPGLISFRMDWLDLLAVQGTLKSLLQYHSSKASIFQRSAFLTVQLSHPYMTTGKTIALTRWTFVGKVMSLLFNMLSRLVILSFQGVSVF